MEEKYRQLRTIVEKEMDGASPAHDINHVMRVYNLCLELASYELDVDMDALKTAALLHDIARTKEDRDGHTHLLSVDHAALGAEMSGKILKELGYPEEKIDHIKHCIAAHRFRGGNPPRTIEAKIRARRFHQIDTYFRVPKGNLKIRETEGQASADIISYERPNIPHIKKSYVMLIQAQPGDIAKEVLTKFLPTKVIVEKIREIYILEETNVHLDQVTRLGNFIELEQPTPDEASARTHKLNKTRCIRYFAN
jgi:predicted adenylyl cyclase CyaB